MGSHSWLAQMSRKRKKSTPEGTVGTEGQPFQGGKKEGDRREGKRRTRCLEGWVGGGVRGVGGGLRLRHGRKRKAAGLQVGNSGKTAVSPREREQVTSQTSERNL